MGSVWNMNEEPLGTSNPSFKVEFTKTFKKLGLKFNFRIRRTPNHDMWQPLFCIVTEKGIDWNYGWNSDNIFTYMKQDRSWLNEIEIEAGELACQIQFRYDDDTKSKIYDIGKFDHNDVIIKLINKNVKSLIIHEPSARQYDELIYGEAAKIDFCDLIPGKEYCEVKKWNNIWTKDDGDRREWVIQRREENNKRIKEKYPNFLSDKSKNTHNISTDGKIFSKKKIEILSVRAFPECSNTEEKNIIEFRKPTFYVSYDVEYGTKDQDYYNSINGCEHHREGKYNEKDSYVIYFVDTYKSGKRNKKQKEKLEAEYNVIKNNIISLKKEIYHFKIEQLKDERINKKLKTFKIGEFEWIKPIVINNISLFNFYYQMIPYIPAGFKLPTSEQLSILSKYFVEHDDKKKVNIYKDKKVKLEIPMLGTQNCNGSNYDIDKNIAIWTDLGEYKLMSSSVNISKILKNGSMHDIKVNHDRNFAAALLLVKE